MTFAGAALIGLMAFREWSVDRQIQSQKAQLYAELKEQIRYADSLSRLQKLEHSAYITQRFLEPIQLQANRLLWPPSRQEHFLQWERQVHQELQDRSYEAKRRLRESTEAELSDLRLKQEPGRERLLAIADLAQGLEDQRERFDLVKMELDEIQSRVLADDETQLAKVKSIGTESLRSLQKEMQSLDDIELVRFLSSDEFFKRIHEPVALEVLKIKQEELRSKTWLEFQKSLIRVLERKNRQLARARPSETMAMDPAQSLAELLKEEYRREKERELSLQQTAPAEIN